MYLSESTVYRVLKKAGLSKRADILGFTAANENGLASDEVQARLKKYGYNEIKFKKRSALVQFLQQFRSALIYVLLAAALFCKL